MASLDELTGAERQVELERALEARIDPDMLDRIRVEEDGDAARADADMPLADGWTPETREEVVADWRFRRRFYTASPRPEPDDGPGDWEERYLAFMREFGMSCPILFPAATRGHVGPDLTQMTRGQRERLQRVRRRYTARRGASPRERDVAAARAAAFSWRCAREPAPTATGRRPRGAGRPRAPRRSSSSSATSGADPGDEEPPPPRGDVAGRHLTRAVR